MSKLYTDHYQHTPKWEIYLARAFTISVIVLVTLVLPAQLVTVLRQQQQNPIVYTATAEQSRLNEVNPGRVAGASDNKYEVNIPALNLYLDLDQDSDLLIAGGVVLVGLACSVGLLLVFLTRREHPNHNQLTEPETSVW